MDARDPPIATLPRSRPPTETDSSAAEGFARLARRRERRLGLVLWAGLFALLIALSS
jgi:hypothetical protein